MDSGMLQNPKLWTFWTWCLLQATHKPRKQMVGMQMVELEPGQFVFGRKSASIALKMSEKSIRTCLKTLEKLENLAIKPTNKFSIVSIMNWDSYQQDAEQSGQQSGHQRASSGPSKGHKQECKHISTEEEKKTTSCPEPQKGDSGPEEKKEDPIMEIPMIDRDGLFLVFQKDIDKWQDTFPGIDVLQTMKRIRTWNEDNKPKRKTIRGIRNHITGWLDREQNRSGSGKVIRPAFQNRSEKNINAAKSFINRAPDAK